MALGTGSVFGGHVWLQLFVIFEISEIKFLVPWAIS